MELTAEQLQQLAAAARLDPAETERGELVAELNDIMAFTGRLAELDPDLEPFERDWHGNTVRTDTVAVPGGQEAALAAAPAREDGFLKVPRTVDADG